MNHFLIKVLISALLIAGASELGKRFSLLGAILASLPVTSILALIWLHLETGDAQKVTALSRDILWAVIPSLLFFLVFPIFLKKGFQFSSALTISCAIMFLGYSVYAIVLRKMGLNI